MRILLILNIRKSFMHVIELCINVSSWYYKNLIKCILLFSTDFGVVLKNALCLFDKVQSKAIRLTNNPYLTKYLQPLSHRRLAGDLSIIYRYFHGPLLSGDQGDYSCSSAACQDHPKLSSFTHFQSFTV